MGDARCGGVSLYAFSISSNSRLNSSNPVAGMRSCPAVH